jgi:hypothetical protein
VNRRIALRTTLIRWTDDGKLVVSRMPTASRRLVRALERDAGAGVRLTPALRRFAGLAAMVMVMVMGCGSVTDEVTTADAGDGQALEGRARDAGAEAEAPHVIDAGDCLLTPGTELVKPCPGSSAEICACERGTDGWAACLPVVCP